jgi:hypothetical protein
LTRNRQCAHRPGLGDEGHRLGSVDFGFLAVFPGNEVFGNNEIPSCRNAGSRGLLGKRSDGDAVEKTSINSKVVGDRKVRKDTKRSCADKPLGQWGPYLLNISTFYGVKIQIEIAIVYQISIDSAGTNMFRS